VSTRSELLREYIARTDGKVIRPTEHYGGQSPDLINDYLRYLTADDTIHIPGNAIDWAITGETLSPGAEALAGIADYTNAYVGKHAPVPFPDIGDVMVFSGPAGNPYGGLGIYIRHVLGDITVWTQGEQNGRLAPAQAAIARGNAVVALGWWRVREDRIHHRRPAPWATNRLPEAAR
jgi:hypothetical protein